MEGRCYLCPRKCGAERSAGVRGACGLSDEIRVARAALHYWEEPCISGDRGSGTVFFTGCALGCIFCQNREIAMGGVGKRITAARLTEIFLELQEKGAHNINLVTPDHLCVQIGKSLDEAKKRGLRIPVVANTGGYLSDEQYDIMKQYTDIWLTDFKYFDPERSDRYSRAPDYPEIAAHALQRMAGDTGRPVYTEDGMMERGIIVRILLLPGQTEDAKKIVKHVWDRYGDSVVMSLMNQYTPPSGRPSRDMEKHPELLRTVTDAEYDELVDYALELGIENAYIQEGGTQEESFIPAFDMEGV